MDNMLITRVALIWSALRCVKYFKLQVHAKLYCDVTGKMGVIHHITRYSNSLNSFNYFNGRFNIIYVEILHLAMDIFYGSIIVVQ